MSLLPYAVSSLVRNRRRTLSSLLGVLLAITFIAGTLIAIDSSARSLLDAYLAGNAGDFSIAAFDSNGSLDWDALQRNVAGVPGVTDVAMYRMLSANGVRNPASNATFPGVFPGQGWAIEPDHLPFFLRGLSVNGSLALSNGTAAITSDIARFLGLTVGGTVQFSTPIYTNGNLTGNDTYNLTVVGVVSPPSSYLYRQGVFVDLTDARWIETQLHQTFLMYQWSGDIWIDRSRFILPYDPDATQFNLLRLGRTLVNVVSGYGASLTDNDIAAAATYAATLNSERLLFLLLSIPVALLGLYLGAVGADLTHADRRREFAVLRSRGASPRQILGILLTEAVLGGLAATFAGLLLGILTSRVFLAVVNPVGASFVPNYTDVFLSGSTLALVLGLSVVFMTVVSYGSARRAAHLSIVETLRYYAPGETRIYYSPAADIILVVYAVAAYVFVSLFTPNSSDLWSFLLTLLFYASIPLTPLLLILGATRLATRSTGKVYEWTARACRPFSRDLEYVVGKDLARNPRRASNVAVIIALGLAFGVFAVSIFGSLEAYQDRIIRAYTGSDVLVPTPYGYNGDFGASLAAVPGVSGVTHVFFGQGSPTWGYAPLTAVDPSSYFAVVQPESFFLGGMSASQAQAILATNGSVLVSQGYADSVAAAVGDSLPLTWAYENKTGVWKTSYANVTVAGIVDLLPGTGLSGSPLISRPSPYQSSPYPGQGVVQGPSVVYGSPDTFWSLWNPRDLGGTGPLAGWYLASLAWWADWRSVKQDIEGLGGANPVMYQELVDTATQSPLQRSVNGFVLTEIAFILVILTAGLGIIVYASSREREVEFAGIMARGASRWQAAGLVMGEAFSIILIGLVAGTVVGLVSGALYDPFLFSTLSSAIFSPVIPFLFEFPLTGFLLLAGAVGAMLLAALLVAWRIAHMDVARVLKLRGG